MKTEGRADILSFYNGVLFFVVFFVLSLAGCQSGGNNNKQKKKTTENRMQFNENRDLEEILDDGVLRAITIFSPTSYFLYRGRPMGFEYELLDRLASSLDLKLEIVVARDLDSLFAMLNRGEGDLVAHGMTITEPRKMVVQFSLPLYESHQVLVQRKPANWRSMKLHEIEKTLITNPLDLIGKKVHVRRNSSYYQRLVNLSQEIGSEIVIEPIQGNITTDEIIKMVVDGKIDYTIADDNIAAINKTYFPILDIETRISFPQRMAWAIRKQSPDLLDTLDHWIEGIQDQVDYYVIYDKYFKNKKQFRKRIKSEFHSESGGKISPYDALIKKYATTLDWDWRFLCSVVYQESRFDPKATSWAGGQGLMQLMPATARSVGVEDRTDPEQSIRGGVAYLKQQYDKWTIISDSVQRIKFTLAAYNCGYYHVLDARKLAEKNDVNPGIWDDHVEEFILKLTYPNHYNDPVVKYGYVRGVEPYEYVREVFERYEHYQRFISP
jgi:membrane-bound lytic murein transglycosylase F